jgi:protein-tyrosine phosphatase
VAHFVDIRAHLLAGLDDGPQTLEAAIKMCRIAYADGTEWMCATAHQNRQYPHVTPDSILNATLELRSRLQCEGVNMGIVPSALVMAEEDMEEAWQQGQLLSIANRKQYLLIEMPHDMFFDLRSTVVNFAKQNLTVVLAHPERQPAILHRNNLIEELIELGAIVQVSTRSVTNPKSALDKRCLRQWFRRGIVHCMASDGHSPSRRLPCMSAAYQIVSQWAGAGIADQTFSINGLKIVSGVKIKPPKPQMPRKSWFLRLFSLDD